MDEFKGKNYYEILGVLKDSNTDTIRKAYYKLARKYHPDKNVASDASDKFKYIKTAYDTLVDPVQRSKYDSWIENDGSTYIFTLYQEIIDELCDKYCISNKSRDLMINVIKPDDFTEEINNNDMVNIYAKIYTKLYDAALPIIANVAYEKLSDYFGF